VAPAVLDGAKWSILPLAWSQGHEVVAVRLHRRGAHAGSAAFGDDARQLPSCRRQLARPPRPAAGAAAPDPGHFGISETPRLTGRAVVALAADPDVRQWTQASLSSGQPAREYGFVDLDGAAPDAWRYIVEVQDAGKPPEPDRSRGPFADEQEDCYG
jgi:hypothetical protein